jgi:hypothetical protein
MAMIIWEIEVVKVSILVETRFAVITSSSLILSLCSLDFANSTIQEMNSVRKSQDWVKNTKYVKQSTLSLNHHLINTPLVV